jgi:hypothetical protein
MTRRSEKLWSDLNCLAETDVNVSYTIRAFRAGLLSWEEMLLTGWMMSAGAHAICRDELLKAISLQPRVYFLKGPHDVCAASGVAASQGPSR